MSDKKSKKEETTQVDTIESHENDGLESQNENQESTESVDPMAKLEAELSEAKDKYLRLYSDFDNYRKRTAKEKIDTIVNATEGLIKDLLPVIDDFERAQKSIENSTDIAAVKEGIELVFNKLIKTLQSKGLKTMETKGEVFDVEKHECITQFAAGDDMVGKVFDEAEKGYLLNDKVIRYAKVIVGN